ncbi:MAG: 3D domain-containing protein [Peptococcales bacterium]|jgi:3D (Asp-Asp-Asp) domain-containing protein
MVAINKKILMLAILLILSSAFTIWISGFNKVTVLIDDEKIEFWTRAETVEDVLLNTKNVLLNSQDLISPSLHTKVTQELTIKVTRVEEKELILKEDIPFKREYKNDNNNLKGQKKIVKKGENGVLAKKYLVTYHDGVEQKSKLIKEEIVKEPIMEIISLGTKQTVQRSGKILDVKQTLIMKSTAYTHTGNKTARGNWPQKGTVAVDPKVIPLGSKLYIDGYGFGIAQDTGNAIKGERIDLFMDTEKEALKWGNRTVKVYILR